MAVNHRQPPTGDLKCSKFGNLLALCLPKLPNHVVWNRVVSYCFEIDKINTMFSYKSFQFSIRLHEKMTKCFLKLFRWIRLEEYFQFSGFEYSEEERRSFQKSQTIDTRKRQTIWLIQSKNHRFVVHCSQIDFDRISN